MTALKTVKTKELFDLTKSRAGSWLEGFEHPWEALGGIKEFLLALGPTLPAEEFDNPAENVWIHKSAKVAPSAFIGAPCVIDEGAEIRHCAFIRGSALIGKNAVVGNSVEVKNAILFEKATVPHFNYVGDSIMGWCAHMGAGAVTSNVKSDKTLVVLHGADGGDIETGLKKFGAMVGDATEVGCNSVLNPGSVLGKNCIVYPTSCFRGVLAANSIYKGKGNIAERR